VSVPSIAGRGCLLHWYAAGCLETLSAAAERDLGLALLVCSGHRLAKPWQATRELYEAELLRRYRPRWPGLTDAQVIQRGSLYLGRRSAHHTGLAVDLRCGGLCPDSATIAAQRKTDLDEWLEEHCQEHGVRRYDFEPWHLEAPCEREVWLSPPPEAPL